MMARFFQATVSRYWRVGLLSASFLVVAVCGMAGFWLRDSVRTLQSLRRVPGTNAYVMDYHLDYHIDELRVRGMDVAEIEDSLIRTLLPDFLVPLARWRKPGFIPQKLETVDLPDHHCSTLAIRSSTGEVFFGRNFDWHHDAFLILRVHDRHGLASISVLDLAYLHLDRPDLEQTNLRQRIPLLFAPYYLMDGINRHGLAVADMSAPARPPRHPGKPSVIHSTLMRLILDRADSTAAAVRLIEDFNIHFVDTPVHLMIGDRAGDFRVVEFIDGKTVTTRSELSWQVCTNHLLYGQSEGENDASCPRYQVGSAGLAAAGEDLSFAEACRVAQTMSNSATMWTSNYQLTSGEVSILYRGDQERAYRDRLTQDLQRN
jgi:hypothetical protein